MDWEYVLATVVATVIAAGVVAVVKAFLDLRNKITPQILLGFGIATIVAMNAAAVLGVFWQVNRNQVDIKHLDARVNEIALFRVPKPQEEGSRSQGVQQASNLNTTANPRFEEVSLNAGFLPDPNVQHAEIGGPVDVRDLGLGEDCIGYASAGPDFGLAWKGTSEELRVSFIAEDGEDTTLLVKLPDGTWSCNDDQSPLSLDPSVVLKTPREGSYRIWIGSFLPDQEIAGELHITELDPSLFPPFAGE